MTEVVRSPTVRTRLPLNFIGQFLPLGPNYKGLEPREFRKFGRKLFEPAVSDVEKRRLRPLILLYDLEHAFESGSLNT